MQFCKYKPSFPPKRTSSCLPRKQSKKLEKHYKKDDYESGRKTPKSFIRNVSNWIKKKTTKIRTKIEMYETHIKMEHYLLLFLVDGKISMKE